MIVPAVVPAVEVAPDPVRDLRERQAKVQSDLEDYIDSLLSKVIHKANGAKSRMRESRLMSDCIRRHSCCKTYRLRV